MTTFLKKVFDFAASYGFACVIFLFLLLLTFLGTLEQVEHGLFDVQQKYFESIFLVHWLFGVIPVPLPGVYLLLVLFSINLICGGIIRMRKKAATIGNLIIHGGMLFMIVAGFVDYTFKQDGHLTLAEGEQSNEFQSYFEWEIAIGEKQNGLVTKEYLIRDSQFAGLDPGDSTTFSDKDLPFDVTLTDYQRNCEPKPANPAASAQGRVVDGFHLAALPKETEAERNIAGCVVAIKDKKTGQTRDGLLWGVAVYPMTFTADGREWTIDLRKRRFPLPFTIALDKFTHERHPRTDTPRTFSSDVTKIENGVRQAAHITMNAPLRDKGYTFYQASWQPANPALGTPVRSTLAVVKNPADRWPLYSCIIISAGLLIHFTRKLAKYLRAENRRLAAQGATA